MSTARVAAVVSTAVLWLAVWLPAPSAQEPPAPTPEEVAAAVNQLGHFDHDPRVKASRTVRRATPEVATAALLRAVDGHADGYVRYRALVLLSAFNDPRTTDVMRRAIDDPNDRLREVGFAWFERHPDVDLRATLLERLDKELGEFVRPALVRALAAVGSDPAVQQALTREVFRGQDFFRSAVIEALGDHKAGYAVGALTEITKQDGPLRDDAALALGRIGDASAVATLAQLQRAAGREEQAIVAAAICLTGRNCDSHRRFLVESLTFASRDLGFQALLRSAATGLGALAERDDAAALQALFDAGVPAQDPVRSPIALAVGRVALRNPARMLASLQQSADPAAALLLLRDAFDMLEEDFDEEMFFASMRRIYWQAAAGSPTRALVNRLMTVLEF